MTALTPSKPGAGPATPAPAGAVPAAAPASRRRIIPLVVAALALGGGGTYYAHARHFEDTDDAQIDGNITNLSPRVAGTLVAVHVQDNQVVQEGEALAEIDPTDYEIAVAQAKAGLAQAEATFNAENPSVPMTQTSNETALSAADADVSSAESGLVAADREVKQLTAQLELAKANAKNAVTERERADKLGAQGAISQAELDTRNTTADAASANVAAMTAALAAAQARYTQAQSRISFTRSHVAELKANAPRQLDVRKASVGAREAALELARAQLRQAELNLAYTKIVAPVAGIVGRKSMSVGDRVAPGQQVLAIARTEGLWVTANFRETQLRDMRPGQPVTIHVDALDLELHGKIESVAGATGSRFSLFPPENASGNFVKVVQRIPVRIALEPNEPGMDRLRPGMSVEPEVRVR
jgi:membrane fusion protein (multidrug efflux system)